MNRPKAPLLLALALLLAGAAVLVSRPMSERLGPPAAASAPAAASPAAAAAPRTRAPLAPDAAEAL